LKELNYGSNYNPTGDPLFYMPYILRIDAMNNGDARRKTILDEYRKWKMKQKKSEDRC